jgi:hypothetical protein
MAPGYGYCKNALPAWHAKILQLHSPVDWIGTVRQRFPRVKTFLGNIRRSGTFDASLKLAKFPFQRRALTSLSGGSHQPLVRQLRYYSVPQRRASQPANHGNEEEFTVLAPVTASEPADAQNATS